MVVLQLSCVRCWSTTTLTLYHLFVLEFENIWMDCGHEKRRNCETTAARSLWAYCWAVNGLKICVLTIFYKINRCPQPDLIRRRTAWARGLGFPPGGAGAAAAVCVACGVAKDLRVHCGVSTVRRRTCGSPAVTRRCGGGPAAGPLRWIDGVA